jgi:hypothetical protein
MGGGRQPDKVWKYAETNRNKEEAVRKPWVDIFQKRAHSDHATKFKLWLAFDCPEFMKGKALEWTELVASLTEKNVQQRKESDKATWRSCVRSVQQRAAGRAASACEHSSHLPSALAKAGAYGGSIAAAGLSAAKVQLATLGAKFMDKYVDSITEVELEALRALLLRWITGKGLPLSCLDGELWDEFIEAIRPACKGKLLNYDKIRRDSMLKKAFTELLAAVNDIKERAGVFGVQLDGWTDANDEYWMNCISTVSSYAFYEEQETPQGEKCDAAFILKSCGKLLNDPRCAGITADNCSGMQDLKKEFMVLAASLKHIVFYVNCMWHGADSIGGALLGLGSAAERGMGFVLEDIKNPRTAMEEVRWTLDMTRKSSLPNKLKGIVKTVRSRQRLRGFFRKIQLEKDAAAKAAWRVQCRDAVENEEPMPQVIYTLRCRPSYAL